VASDAFGTELGATSWLVQAVTQRSPCTSTRVMPGELVLPNRVEVGPV
jgi:hypothetical protein